MEFNVINRKIIRIIQALRLEHPIGSGPRNLRFDLALGRADEPAVEAAVGLSQYGTHRGHLDQ